MIFIWIAAWLLFFYRAELIPATPDARIDADYISIARTTAVKGVFVLLVFLRHFKQYIVLDNRWDSAFLYVDRMSAQLIVVMFLFYSGYGVMESIKRKGDAYIRTIPKQRIAKTLLHFDLVICLFLVVQALVNHHLFRWSTIIKTLLAWKSMGNSNWFIFVILLVYALTWLAFTVCAQKSWATAVWFTTVLCLCAVPILYAVRDGQTYWSNTILCYPLGMWYSLLHHPVEQWLLRARYNYRIALITTMLGFVMIHYAVLHSRRDTFANVLLFQIGALWFVVLVLLFTMKVRVGNAPLMWLGRHVFSVYMLQRIFMLWLDTAGLNAWNRYVYFFVCLALTVLASELFDRCMKPLDAWLFPKTPKRYCIP